MEEKIMKKCSKCGAECSDNLLYCDKCGTLLTETKSQNAAYVSTAAVKGDEKSNGLVILLLIFFFPVGLYIMWKYKKSWSQTVKIVITAFFGILIIISAANSGSSTTTTTTTTTADNSSSKSSSYEQDKSNSSEEDSVTEKETEEPTVDAATAERQYKNKCSEIDYESIARDAKGFEGNYFTFTGEIVQDIGDGSYSLAVTFDEYGIYEDRIIFTFDTGDGIRILEGDTVQIWGVSEGIVNAETVMGSNVSIPCIAAEYVDLYY